MRFLWSFWEQEALESEGGEEGRAVGQGVPDGLVDELHQGKRTPLKMVLLFKKKLHDNKYNLLQFFFTYSSITSL